MNTLNPDDLPKIPTAHPAGEYAYEPILKLEEIKCPHCGEVLASNATVCIKCGYDLRANIIHTPTVSHAEELEAESDSEAPADFVPPSRVGIKTLLICSALATVAALVLTGIRAASIGGGFSLVLARILLTLYEVLILTATGVVAVLAAAVISRQKFNKMELVAARMLLTVAVFQAVRQVVIPGVNPVLNQILVILGAVASYVLLIMGLFKKDRFNSALMLVIHAILWLVLSLGMDLAAWVHAATPATPRQESAPVSPSS